MIHKLINLLRPTLHEQTWVNTEHLDHDDLYPLIIAQGTILVDREDIIEYPNSAAIVNQDKSLTIISEGNIIAWHDDGTYWRVASK